MAANPVKSQRLQYEVYAGLALGAAGLAAMAYFSDNLAFHRLLGAVNPFGVIVPLMFVGFILLFILLSHNWFAIIRKGTLKGVLLSAGLASVLGLIAILIDHAIVYPAQMNVAFPMSLAYYPSVAFFAEIVFHLMPLTLISILLSAVFRNSASGKIIWIAILIASLSDPVFQVFDAVANHYPPWAVLVTAIHVFAVNFLMLAIFKRYDFVSLLSFRLVYYVIWHIVWGTIRLHVLF
jgi:hypothetical protein